MNEFEWRQQMRALRQPSAPRRDLWNAIETALDTRDAGMPAVATRPQRRWLQAAALAGAFLLAGGIGARWQRDMTAAPTGTVAAAAAAWHPADPRLAGAAIELDAARMELQQAMQQTPGSPMLQRLLARTEHQQNELRRMPRDAG